MDVQEKCVFACVHGIIYYRVQTTKQFAHKYANLNVQS